MHPSLLELHTTVQFVGRDLDVTQVKDVIAATFDVFTQPIFLHFTGHLLSWGTKKGRYLVAEVNKTLSSELLVCRNELRERLGHLHIRDDFEYNPHMTIAEGLPGPQVMPPFGVDPFELFCTEVEVKYGNQKMKVNLL
jgi:2'-5' RNA ligase